MAETLNDLLKNMDAESYATAAGTEMHLKLQHAGRYDDIMARIRADATLARLFDDTSVAEVPLAGYISGVFVSRRIDRLRIDRENKTIDILDYKTDTDRALHRADYARQLNEYRGLLAQIYPDYKIKTYILWTHDWTLEVI